MRTYHKHILTAVFFIFTPLLSKSQSTVDYFFTSSLNNWTLVNSLSNGGNANGAITLKLTGSDPYMLSPTNLGLSASTFYTVYLRLKNNTTDNAFRIFWITDADGNWNAAKSLPLTVSPNDTEFKEYYINMSGNSQWSGTIKQIRFDPGENATSGSVELDFFTISTTPLLKNNGYVYVKVDHKKGGAISYISEENNKNSVVNIRDKGRYIQQSYYAGKDKNRQAEGQSPSWSPWPWNPIQVGDTYNNPAQLSDSYIHGDTIYTKTRPLLWDMRNEYGECYFEQWTVPDNSVIHVRNKLTTFRTDTLWEVVSKHQELPAVYTIADLNKLYTYQGNSPFTGDTMTIKPNVFFWSYWVGTENWAAYVNASNWGLGVFSPRATLFAGGMSGSPSGGPYSGNTGYIAPIGLASLDKNTIYEYNYDLILGNLSDIRQYVYNTAPLYEPRALFTFDKSSLCGPGNVQFSDQSSNYPTAWRWNFGDGSSSTGTNPIHRYSAPGVYTVSLTVFNNFGGDSVAVSGCITVRPVYNRVVNIAICEGDSYYAGGSEQTVSGTYYDYYQSVDGCDSTVRTNLSVKNNTNSSLNESACGSYTLNSQTYVASGTYTQMLTNAAGCDSTIILNLTINAFPELDLGPDTTLCINNGEIAITLDAGVAESYIWSDGSSGQNLRADTVSYPILTNNIIYVTALNSNCSMIDTIVVFFDICEITGTSNTKSENIKIYPNPATDRIIIEGTPTGIVEITDLLGHIIIKAVLVQGKAIIDISELPTGVYALKIETKDSIFIKKLIKE